MACNTFAPCMPGFVLDPKTCICTTSPTTMPPAVPGSAPGAPKPASAAAPWYQTHIKFVLAVGAIALFMYLKRK